MGVTSGDTGEPDLSTFAGRLRFAMRAAGKTNQSALAREIGVKPQAIQYLVAPSNSATGSTHVAALAGALNVNPQWLATGKGPMERIAVNRLPPPAPPTNYADRREVFPSDWGTLQDVKLVMTEEELAAVRERADRIRRVAQQQMAELASAAKGEK